MSSNRSFRERTPSTPDNAVVPSHAGLVSERDTTNFGMALNFAAMGSVAGWWGQYAAKMS